MDFPDFSEVLSSGAGRYHPLRFGRKVVDSWSTTEERPGKPCDVAGHFQFQEQGVNAVEGDSRGARQVICGYQSTDGKLAQ